MDPKRPEGRRVFWQLHRPGYFVLVGNPPGAARPSISELTGRFECWTPETLGTIGCDIYISFSEPLGIGR